MSRVDPGSGIAVTEIDQLDCHPDGHVRLRSVADVRPVFVRGGTRWRTAHEPLGPTLAALAAGAEHVLAAHLEIEARGSGPLARSLGHFYQRTAAGVAPPAALAAVLRDPTLRERPLHQWAALMVVGTRAGAAP